MLALVYLFVMVALGDAICRRFYAFVSLPHRFAAAFLSGLLINTWWTYGAAWLFSGFSSPMLWGNLVYFITAIGMILWLRQRPEHNGGPQPGEFEKWDWVTIGLAFLLVCWMAFATFDMTDGKLQIAQHQWSDFGSNVSIMQSFAMGNNFPTEYPHFPGERIHYHFLFYFAAGNLEYLGLNPAMANNVLFIPSTLSMLVLIMTLGLVVFTSRVVGRIAAAIFFFHGSLSFIPWLYSRGLSNIWTSLTTLRDFLPSSFPYRGETWGVWSQVVFLNQRHLASSVGIFLVVLVFVLLRYREAKGDALVIARPEPVPEPPADTAEKQPEPAPAEEAAEPQPEKPKKAKRGSRKSAKESTDIGDVQKFAVKAAGDAEAEKAPADKKAAKITKPAKSKNGPTAAGLLGEPLSKMWPWIFSGLLLGLMPMWNGAVFTAAAAVLAALLVLFPLRRQMLVLGITAGIVALPQIMFLKTGNIQPSPSLFHWGYTVDNPGVLNVLWYLIFTFGFKWLLIVVALILAKRFQRRFFIAISVLIAVAFFMQFSEEVLANHKFLNIWLILANLFVAFGLWTIWNLNYLKNLFVGKVLAVLLTVLITLGGVIDLFPIHNSFWMELGFVDDPLIKWVTEKTDPKSVFLSFRYVNHRILLAGRRVYFGHPYYAWSAGYQTFDRDATYRRMFEETNQNEVLKMLHANNISYVAIDNQLRNDLKNHNEATVFQAYFQKVFDDTDNKYDNLKIYQVPAAVGAPNADAGLGTGLAPGTGTNAFMGGAGSGAGQFTKPRGIAADTKGNIYVADFGNSRVQKFDTDGKFIASFGTAGEAEGQFKEPNGVVADAAGNVYVVDALNHKLVKFSADGKFVKEWKGPADNTFYGPRDLAIAPNKQIYIVDQGRGRIVRFDPATENFTEFGTLGSGEGQFHEATGIGIAGNFVVVADAGNNRIEVFDLDGKFVRQWTVPVWQFNVDPWHYPDVVYDDQAKKLYATSGWTSEVLAYDLDGNLTQGGFKLEGDTRMDNPSSLVISEANKRRRVLVLNSGGNKISPFDLEATAAAKK
jgi:DNA-binding beta-propeller fold protein YncE